jgi:hypothetical protein
MIAFSYIDFPLLPADLLTDVYASVEDDIPLVELPFEKYKLLTCRQSIKNFVTPFFDKPVYCGVQAILNNQGVHIDFNRTIVYNYIVETGGEHVTTSFYTNKNKNKKIESICIEPYRWHRLKVFLPHEVEGITGKRIAITVWEK